MENRSGSGAGEQIADGNVSSGGGACCLAGSSGEVKVGFFKICHWEKGGDGVCDKKG